MCDLDINISFVFMKPLYLCQWCWLGRWCPQEVMRCLQLSSALFVDPPAELRGSTWDEPARWPNNIRVFERFPRDTVNMWITCVNPQIAVSSDAHYLSASFICMSYLCLFLFLDAQSSDALQTHFYQTASRLFLCLLCWKIEPLF